MALKIFFGSLAADYIAESGRTGLDVAQALGVPENKITKLKNGNWSYIAEDKLLAMISEIAKTDRSKAANLMVAYLIDMTPEKYRPLIDIKPHTGDASVHDGGLAGKWSPTLRAKVEAIAAAYGRDKDFKRMTDNLGEWAVSVNNRA